MKALIQTAFFVLINGLLIAMSTAQAGEDALYAADAPDGAAFIRVVNADASGAVAEASVGGKVIKEVEPLEASPYIYLAEGRYSVDVDGQQVPVTMKKNEFYTVVVLASGDTKVLKDVSFDNPRKALLSFYNLTSTGGVALKTSDGKVAVIDEVSSLDVANREINAVTIELGAFLNNQALAKTSEVKLQRGKVFSIFAIDVGGEPRLVVAESQVDTSV
ncbi:alginate O-acetyltransferase AlgF [Marinobacter goseongensis]|uniref:alginate O-acetyltransferase AlgF n=1 Tax=Marinobacter goseongensis TaxID=453838 RepID=UPI002002F2E5|nr:alginate O-acetyltransferase AlgF [Marinobacter goseongensis]MCK7551376.1 alginate O-acetyltransferase AlgF [Marinobacter goseongensis]